MKYILTLLIIFTSCKTTKIYRPTIEELNTKIYVEVSLQELLQNKERYHGQFVQTKGIFHFGFEECAIYYDMNIVLGDTIIKQTEYCGLWIEFKIHDPLHSSYPDSLKNKFVTVRGYYDTTRKGHVGGCYQATLSNTYDLKIGDKED
jgi:hypothetical protein